MGGKGGSKIDIVKYFMGLHYGVCHGPVDKILGIYAEDKIVWEGDVSDPTELTIDKPDLFGGAKKEGGLVGKVQLLPGKFVQLIPEKYAALVGLTTATCPAYRGMTSLWFTGDGGKGFQWSINNPYIKAIKVKVQRRSVGLPIHNAMIGNDSNPAHILYEVLTNQDWGMGANPASVDVDSFNYAANVLFNEGFGLSLKWIRQAKIEKFAAEILDHINASMYIAPATGKHTIKLVRDDYDANTLPVLDPTNTVMKSFNRKMWGETTNEIIVTWTNPENEQEETVSVQDLANIAMQNGQVVSDGRNYYGVRNKDLAMELGLRDLRVAATPLASFQLECDRTLWDKIVPGGEVKLNWPDEGISGAVLRVGQVDYGKPGDQKIRFNATEDVFADTPAAFSAPPSSEWVDPSEPPSPLAYTEVQTAPYHLLLRRLGASAVGDLAHPDAFTAILGAQTGQDTVEYDLISDINDNVGGTTQGVVTTLDVISRAQSTTTMAAEINSVAVGYGSSTQGSGPKIGSYVFIGGGADELNEIAVVTAVGVNDVTLQRGCLDTIPRAWPIGTPMWFVNDADYILDRRAHVETSAPSYQATPRTSQGTLAVASAPTFSEALTDRAWRPNRPANVQVNGVGFGSADVTLLPDVPVTWERRNRLTEENTVLAWDAGDVSPEAGQTTTIEVRSLADALLATHSGLGGTSFNVPKTSFGVETEGYIRVFAERDGLQSLQPFSIHVTVA